MPYKDKKRQAQAAKEHYTKNKKKMKKRAAEWNKKNREALRKLIHGYLLVHPCVDCGEDDPIVLEFDHVRDEKLFTIGNAVSRNYGRKRVRKEIAKCDVRCANCHRRKTYYERK